MTYRVFFRGSRQEALRIVTAVKDSLVGAQRDSEGIAKACFVALGIAALSDIKADFVRKSRGGTGEDGVKWKPLSPKTLAYSRRFGPGEKAALKRAAGLNQGHRFAPVGTGLLSSAQLASWKRHYAGNLSWLQKTKPLSEAKQIAAAIAWNRVKAEGAKTKLEVFGNRPHEILRDTGVLLNSLSPGQIGGSGTNYSKPSGEGGPEQVFTMLANGVIVGTTVKYAAVHQEGSTKRNIPARPFLPKKTPQQWMQRWMGVLSDTLAIGLERALSHGGQNA